MRRPSSRKTAGPSLRTSGLCSSAITSTRLSLLGLSGRNWKTKNDLHRQRPGRSRENHLRRRRRSRAGWMHWRLDVCASRLLCRLPLWPRILSRTFPWRARPADDPSSYERLLGLQRPAIFRIGSWHLAFVGGFVRPDFFWSAVSLSVEKSFHRRGRRDSAQQGKLPQYTGLHHSECRGVRDLDRHG